VPNEEDDDLDGDGKINHGGLTKYIFIKLNILIYIF